MKTFLTEKISVREFHPSLHKYSSSQIPEDLVSKMEESLTKKDNNLFKKEGKDDNNELGDKQAMDVREGDITNEQLVTTLRDRMVQNIVNLQRDGVENEEVATLDKLEEQCDSENANKDRVENGEVTDLDKLEEQRDSENSNKEQEDQSVPEQHQ